MEENKKLTIRLNASQAICWKQNKRTYALVCHADDEPLNPRRDNDNVDIMVCWHSRYDLGDELDDASSYVFWNRLVRESVSEGEILAAAEAGKLPGIKIKRLNDNCVSIYEVRRWETAIGNSEPELELVYEEVNNDVAGSFLMEDLTTNHCMTLMKPYAEWMPLWLYDHSGITMSCGDRNPFHDNWDSMQVGWIVMLKSNAEALVGDGKPHDWRAKAIAYMTASVDEYDKYISGEVYYYELFSQSESDSTWEDENVTCGGFLGDDICENGALDELAHDLGLEKAIESGDCEVKTVSYQAVMCID